MREARFDRALTPREIAFLLLRLARHRLRELQQPLGRVGSAVEDEVLDPLEQICRDVLVHHQLPGVHDAHVHAGADGVVEERRVNRLAHDLVAAERERHIADAAADLHARARLLEEARRLDEVDGVVRVLLEARADGEHVRIEDDVVRIEPRPLDEQRVGPLENLDLPLDRVGLAALVERHHHDPGAVTANDLCLAQEVGFALLQADRVDDPFPLQALQAGLDDGPLRAVDHHRQTRDLRIGGDVVEELRHRPLGIEQRLVHVDVDHVGAAAHLVERDRGRFAIVPIPDQAREPARAGDVGALADHLEVGVGANRERFQS